MTIKQYSLAAVNETVELGKDGHVIDGSNTTYVEFKDKDGNLIRVKGAAASASTDFVIKSQLDAVNALAGGYLSYSYDASSGISQLSGQGSGDAGAILYGDTYKIGTSGTFLGVSAQAGDLVTALVAGADVSDNTSSNTDWMLIEIRTASDLADDVTLEASSGKIQVKDGGVSTDKLAAESVTVAKMAANSVDSDQYVDGSIDTAHYADASITNAKLANAEIAKAKLTAAVQNTLTNADNEHSTRTPNFASAIGGSFDPDNDEAIAAQTNYLTTTTIVGQLQQTDSRLKTVYDDELLRTVSATHDGGAQNVGASIKSGRTLLGIRIKPTTVANGSGCTMTVGVSGNAAKYVSAADIDLYEGTTQYIPLNDVLSSDEQIIVTVSQGSATQGTFFVSVEHG